MSVLLEKKGRVAYLTIKREEALNALNSAVLDALKEKVTEIENDKEVVVVILTGAGEKAFVAGADIAEMKSLSPEEAFKFSKKGQDVFDLIENSSKFYIAAVNGFALGGGNELAMSCDIRIASENARFGQPEVSLGIIAGFGGTQRLVRTVGLPKAKELLVTGEMIKAEEAQRIGLVNKVVAKEELIQKAEEVASKILKNSAYSVSASKKSANASFDLDAKKGMDFEALLFSSCFANEDQKEGMEAFLQKRSANFKS